MEERILAVKPALLDETGSFTASTLASRITKTLDLMGGAMAIDTSTCSSLAALDAASGMLRSGACSLVLCAGASRAMESPSYELLALRGSLAAGGVPVNRFTGAQYPGEGVAVVLLKRWSDAKRDGDRIFGVVQQVRSRMLASDEVEVSAEAYRDPLLKQIGHTQSAQGIVSLVSATIATNRGNAYHSHRE